MQVKTPEGTLTIEDDRLTVEYYDNDPTLTVSLDPVPEVEYQRGIYGTGTLSVGSAVLVLRNEQASEVVEELRRERKPKAAPVKAAPKADK